MHNHFTAVLHVQQVSLITMVPKDLPENNDRMME